MDIMSTSDHGITARDSNELPVVTGGLWWLQSSWDLKGIPSQLEPDVAERPAPRSASDKPRPQRSLTAVCDLQSTPRATWHGAMANGSRPKPIGYWNIETGIMI